MLSRKLVLSCLMLKIACSWSFTLNRALYGRLGSRSLTAAASGQDGRTLKVVSWNVNSINKRLPNLLTYIEEYDPDVLALQEIKCQRQNFPTEALQEAGYDCIVHPQKTFNGVAILSKTKPTDIEVGLDGDSTDHMEPQSRFIAATIEGIRICNLYHPNGNPVLDPNGVYSDKFYYRLRWTERLKKKADELLDLGVPFIMLGDFNTAPEDVDCYDPVALKNDAVTQPESREGYALDVGFSMTSCLSMNRRYRALRYKGLYDAHEALQLPKGRFTFYGYQGGAWQQGHGMKIDHILLSAQVVDRLQGAGIHDHVRGWDEPSDHVPVFATIRVG